MKTELRFFSYRVGRDGFVYTLQAVDTEICVIKRQSMDRRCDVLMRVHELNGCGHVPLSYDTLRKRLAVAVREYGFILSALADMEKMGVAAYPTGLLSECGGCWTCAHPVEVFFNAALHWQVWARIWYMSSFPFSKLIEAWPFLQTERTELHSVNMDYCYKLNHLKRADASGDVWDKGTKPPPNSRFFIEDSEVVKHLRQPHAADGPNTENFMCSNFKADAVCFHMLLYVRLLPQIDQTFLSRK
jgi:hypothetical protein